MDIITQIRNLIDSYKKNIERLEERSKKYRDNDVLNTLIQSEVTLYECVISDLEKIGASK